MSESNPVTERYHDKNCRVSPLESLSEDNARWLANRQGTIDSVVRVQRIRQENPQLAVACTGVVYDDETRPVVMAVASEDGAAYYGDINDFMNASRRTVKRRVTDLQNDGVLTVDHDAKPAVVAFTSEVVELLIEDALSLFFSTNNKMK